MQQGKETLVLRCAADVKMVSDQQHITVDKTHITIDVEYPYNIELSRCNTTEKILGWVLHLSEKKWMTPIILRGFIHAACRAHNLEIVYG